MQLLIVEDEPGIANFLKQGLEEEFYTVDLAEDGQLGLDMALSNKYDLLLLDWVMPKLSGIDLMIAFRATNKTTPIIFLTAKDTLEETILALKQGANDYIKKPFHFEEILERIKVQLRPKLRTDERINLGNISLNSSNRQVFKEDTEVHLTQKEFDLLEYLIKNKGVICKRTDIIKEVWDIHFEYHTGVIDVYINSLRKKLDLQKEEDYIQTVRGVGYIAKEV